MYSSQKRHIIKSLQGTSFFMLNLTCKDSLFMFNVPSYIKIDGVQMNSTLGSTLANILLCHYENHWLAECLPNLNPCLL